MLLAYAAYGDLTRREVENWVPVALVAGGVGFAIFDSFASGTAMPLILALASGGIGFALALAIFYAGSMGGADCKMLIGVSTVFPIIVASPLPSLRLVNPFAPVGRRILPMFSLSWLVNSLLVSLLVPLGLLARNVHDLARGRIGRIGLRTIPAFFVGYRTRVGNLRPSFLIPLERFEEAETGEIRVLRYSRGILDEDEERAIISKVRSRLSDDDPIWAFPYVPFIAPMLVAFFITLFLGDLLVGLVMSL